MNEFINKLMELETSVATEKGSFSLFALFLREDAPDVWDLLISAPWIEIDKQAALRYIAEKLNVLASPEELTKLSRIVIIERSNPALEAFHSAISAEHQKIEIKDSNFFGLQIKHAYIFTSRRADEINQPLLISGV